MRNRGIWPNEFTFAPLLKSCANICGIELGRWVHAEVIRLGFEWFSSVRIGIVEVYVGCGRMEDARKVFDEMPRRNVIVWNLMVRGYCKTGDVEMGFRLFREMRERSIVSWNSRLSSEWA